MRALTPLDYSEHSLMECIRLDNQELWVEVELCCQGSQLTKFLLNLVKLTSSRAVVLLQTLALLS